MKFVNRIAITVIAAAAALGVASPNGTAGDVTTLSTTSRDLAPSSIPVALSPPTPTPGTDAVCSPASLQLGPAIDFLIGGFLGQFLLCLIEEAACLEVCRQVAEELANSADVTEVEVELFKQYCLQRCLGDCMGREKD